MKNLSNQDSPIIGPSTRKQAIADIEAAISLLTAAKQHIETDDAESASSDLSRAGNLIDDTFADIDLIAGSLDCCDEEDE